MRLIIAIALLFAISAASGMAAIEKPAVQTLGYECMAPGCFAIEDITIGVCRYIEFSSDEGNMRVLVCDKDADRYELYMQSYADGMEAEVCVEAGCVDTIMRGFASFTADFVPIDEPTYKVVNPSEFEASCYYDNEPCALLSDETVGVCRSIVYDTVDGEIGLLVCHKEASRYELYRTDHPGAMPFVACVDDMCIDELRGFDSLLLEPMIHAPTARIEVLDPFPIDNAYAFRCIAESETYRWIIEGEEYHRNVDDIYHAFSSEGFHTVTCIAGGANATLIVSVEGPVEPHVSITPIDATIDEYGASNEFAVSCNIPGYIPHYATWTYSTEAAFTEAGPSFSFNDSRPLGSGEIYLQPGDYDIGCLYHIRDERQMPEYYEEGPTYRNITCHDCLVRYTVPFTSPPYPVGEADEPYVEIEIRRQIDLNAVLRCSPYGFEPLYYEWDFGEGWISQPVRDKLHTFDGNGTYDVRCRGVSDDIIREDERAIEIITPVAREDLGLPEYGNGRVDNGWGIMITYDKIGDMEYELECRAIGYSPEAPPGEAYGYNFYTLSQGVTIEQDGRMAIAVFDSPGEYEIGCSAGVPPVDFPPYYTYPMTYHNWRVVCSTTIGGCTGYGVSTVIVVGEEEP
jgi:hypothetical protein